MKVHGLKLSYYIVKPEPVPLFSKVAGVFLKTPASKPFVEFRSWRKNIFLDNEIPKTFFIISVAYPYLFPISHEMNAQRSDLEPQMCGWARTQL